MQFSNYYWVRNFVSTILLILLKRKGKYLRKKEIVLNSGIERKIKDQYEKSKAKKKEREIDRKRGREKEIE